MHIFVYSWLLPHPSLYETLMDSWNVFIYVLWNICCWKCKSDGGHISGNGDVTVNDTNSEYSDVNLVDSGAGDITIRKKSTTQKGSKYKNVPQRAP